MSAHTPGPWTIGDENNQHIEICIGDAVANLDRQDRYGIHMVFSREEMRANGHLIAAAPELLEALTAISPFIPKTSASEGGASKYSANVVVADKIRAAIARATGESQS